MAPNLAPMAAPSAFGGAAPGTGQPPGAPYLPTSAPTPPAPMQPPASPWDQSRTAPGALQTPWDQNRTSPSAATQNPWGSGGLLAQLGGGDGQRAGWNPQQWQGMRGDMNGWLQKMMGNPQFQGILQKLQQAFGGKIPDGFFQSPHGQRLLGMFTNGTGVPSGIMGTQPPVQPAMGGMR